MLMQLTVVHSGVEVGGNTDDIVCEPETARILG